MSRWTSGLSVTQEERYRLSLWLNRSDPRSVTRFGSTGFRPSRLRSFRRQAFPCARSTLHALLLDSVGLR